MTEVGTETAAWTRATRIGGRRSVHEFVRDELRRAILGGEIAAGSRLVQADIAKRLDVSTTPVREALRDLTSEGLVTFDAHGAGFVRRIDPTELDEIQAIRAVLEPLSLTRALERIGEAQIAALEEIHGQMLAEQDLGTWMDLNRRFHNLHHEAAHSPRLWSMVVSLQNATVVSIGAAVGTDPVMRERAHADHAGIISALRRRDREALVRIIVDHIQIPFEHGDVDRAHAG